MLTPLLFLLFAAVVHSRKSYRPDDHAYKDRLPSTQMPTSPPASTCDRINGYNLRPLVSRQIFYSIPGSNGTGAVRYSICNTINMACGEAGEPCSSTSSNCCGACQSWVEADGPQNCSLGTYSSYSVDPSSNTITITYLGGDSFQGIQRALTITLTCNISAGFITTTGFTPANGHEPNQPYWYSIVAQTNLTCDSCSRVTSCTKCTLGDCFLVFGYESMRRRKTGAKLPESYQEP